MRSVMFALVLAVGCGGTGDARPAVDGGVDAPPAVKPPPVTPAEYLATSAPLFDPNHVLEVAIEMAPADWEALRTQRNDPLAMFQGDCQAGPPPKTFTYYASTVTIDGERLPDVAIRKKGFLASLSASKPSLKLDFDKYVPGREFHRTEGLTFNNVRQDASYLKTCLAYRIFGQAGLPVPRCNFAHITVNGADLGIYVHVEAISKRMLATHFSNSDGNLYEGLWSDFRDRWINTFEAKTATADRTDLAAVTAALTKPPAERMAALAELVELDNVMTVWAAENLIGSWDGYSNTVNNFFAYFEPTGRKMHFLPWGPDWAFTDADVWTGDGRPPSISAHGYLAYRIYELPEGKQRYRDKLLELLTQIWNEEALLAEIDRMRALIAGHVVDPHGQFAPAVAELKSWIQNRRGVLEADLANGPPAWTYPLKAPPCLTVAGTVTATFSAKWDTYHKGTVDELAQGLSSITIDMPGRLQTSAVAGGAAAGWDNKRGLGPRPIAAMGGLFQNGKVYAIGTLVTPELWTAGSRFPFDWQSAVGGLVEVDPETGHTDIIGVLFNGTVRLDSASYQAGQNVTGSVEAVVMVGAWD